MKIPKSMQEFFLSREAENRRLEKAIIKGNSKGAIKIIKRGIANVNQIYSYDLTPLHLAAQYGLYFVTLELIKSGALIDALDRFGTTPLYQSLFPINYNDTSTSPKVSLLLIENNANILLSPRHMDQESPVPLLAALNNSIYPVVDKLVSIYKLRKLDVHSFDILNQHVFMQERKQRLVNFCFIYNMLNEGIRITNDHANTILSYLNNNYYQYGRVQEIPEGFRNAVLWYTDERTKYLILLCMSKTNDLNANKIADAGSNGPAKIILKYL